MNEQETEVKSGRRVIGRVVSDKMDKTVSVAIERLVRHPVVGKYVRRTSKLLAHDESNECKAGDRVAITECRRIAKNKSWRVIEIIERAPEQISATVDE